MRKFFTATVGRQLGASFGLMVVVVLLLALTAWSKLNAMNANFVRLVDTSMPALTALSEVNDKLQLVRMAELKHLAALTMPAKDREEAAITAAAKDLDSSVSHYLAASSEVAKGDQQKALVTALAAYNATRPDFLQMSNSAAGAEGDRAVEASDFFNGNGQRAYQNAYAAVHQLWGDYLEQADGAKRVGQATVVQATTTVLCAALLAAVLSIVLATVISRLLIAQLGAQPRAVASLAATISRADLTTPIAVSPQHGDSIVGAMARMQDALVHIVLAVRTGAEGVASASAEIAMGNQDLSMRTEDQASALEETASAMNALSAAVTQNAERAMTANQLATQASTVAQQGGAVVGQVVHTMKGINDSSRKIADIIGVIDGIAFQTNILALNAAVEAARAGEQGRGFAVVASEVRSLASRSAEAAKEIKSLIAASVERVELGAALVDQAGATMSKVVASIGQVADIVREISDADMAQSVGVQKIGEAVGQMDRTTQQNAAMVEQMAAAASGLKAQAGELVDAVSIFKLNATEQPQPAPRQLAQAKPRPAVALVG